MKPHFTEADLLETYYTRPGESLPIMMHLADCTECAARYERLERKMESLRSCPHDEKPETFWARQRIAILRKVDTRRSSTPVARMAAAAVVVLAVGGLFAWNVADEPASLRPVEAPVSASLDDSTPRPLDDSPWQSEELNEYSSMVNWESWVEDPS